VPFSSCFNVLRNSANFRRVEKAGDFFSPAADVLSGFYRYFVRKLFLKQLLFDPTFFEKQKSNLMEFFLPASIRIPNRLFQKSIFSCCFNKKILFAGLENN
jgi:hypothetical protein